jgi:hypothetical protein
MKKITKIFFALMLALPCLLHAQYIGGNGRGDVMVQLLNSPITNIGDNNTSIPTSFSLEQNYPNPFSQTTYIKFVVAKASDVEIVVYDVMGREIQALINKSMKPGMYEVSFDGSSLSSGVYFYKISAGEYSETKQMMLEK